MSARAKDMTPRQTENQPISDPLKTVTDKVAAMPLRSTREAVDDKPDDGARQQAFKRLVASRGRRYADATVSTFDQWHPKQAGIIEKIRSYLVNLPERVSEGESVILFGPPGTGKDHLLMSMMRCATLRDGLSVKWTNGQTLWSQFRDAIDGTKSESEMMAELTSCDVLAISDPLPQFGALTSHQANCLFRILDHRYSNLRPTWITLNVAAGKEAEERIGAAIIDRLRDQGHALHCNWPSHRKLAT